MSTYEITRVRTETTANDPHEHITEVELSNKADQRFMRSTIVKDLAKPRRRPLLHVREGASALMW